MPPVLLCSVCGAIQKKKPWFFLVKRDAAHSHYHRLCPTCNTGEPRKKLEGEGWVDHQHITTR